MSRLDLSRLMSSSYSYERQRPSGFLSDQVGFVDSGFQGCNIGRIRRGPRVSVSRFAISSSVPVSSSTRLYPKRSEDLLSRLCRTQKYRHASIPCSTGVERLVHVARLNRQQKLKNERAEDLPWIFSRLGSLPFRRVNHTCGTAISPGTSVLP